MSTAPWFHGVRFEVELIGRPRKGNQLVKWLEGPLKGRESRIASKSISRDKTAQDMAPGENSSPGAS